MNDILSNPNLPQGAIIILGTLTFALFAWLPQPDPVKAECEKPVYLPTASDAPSYTWEWPIIEQETHKRRGRRG